MQVLNEKNIQSNFCYNPNDGIYHPLIVKHSISLSSENKYIKIYDDKAIIDLGYSIYNTEENPPIIKIDDRILIVRMLGYETDILATEIKSNEAIIITLAPEFSTSVFINSENIADNKNMSYEIESLNTSLSSWMLDIISKNINRNIPTLENDVDVNKNNINILDNRIDENDSDISSLSQRISSNDNDISSNDRDISTLAQRVTSNDSDIANINSTKQNKLVAGPNIIIDGNTISAQSTDASLSGMIMAFAGHINNIPSNAFFCDGRELSRTTYARLFAKISTYWGAGNGSTTFNLPDGRGGVLKGAGTGNKYSRNENRGSVGSYQNTAIINGTASTYIGSFISGGSSTNGGLGSGRAITNLYSSSAVWSGSLSDFSVPTGTTNRDNNLAVNFVIFV